MEEDNIFKTINEKINTLSIGKKLLLIVCLLLIFGSLYYISTIDVVEHVDYLWHGEVQCSETYINGVMNSSPCPQNTLYFPVENKWILNESILQS